MNNKYDDIINLPHPVSLSHPQMSIWARSAQFAPFSALTGYEEAVKEASRLTNNKIELDDYDKLLISNRLQIINDSISDKPFVNVTYFVCDEKKSGGKYVSVSGILKKVNVFDGYIVFDNNIRIKIDDIIDIDSDMFKKYDIL